MRSAQRQRENSHSSYLLIATACTLLFHVFALLSLQNATITSHQLPERASFPLGGVGHVINNTRTEQLTTAIRQMVEPTPEPSPIKFDLDALNPEFIPPIASTQEIPTPVDQEWQPLQPLKSDNSSSTSNEPSPDLDLLPDSIPPAEAMLIALSDENNSKEQLSSSWLNATAIAADFMVASGSDSQYRSFNEKNLLNDSHLERAHSDWDSPGVIASSDDFNVKVKYAQKKDGQGYFFELLFVPKEGITFKRIRQNAFFLIDRSLSIEKSRYEASKEAVLQALTLLKPEDTFNILVFDDKIVRMAESNVPVNKANLFHAQNFLTRQQYGGLFASTDLYTYLNKIVPEAVEETEVNSAILLSDGDTFLKLEDQRRTISNWTSHNGRKVALFAVACDKGNNLPLLDLLSAYNKGWLQYCPRNQDLSTCLKNLVKKISNPIGKDIVATVVVPEETAHISIYPRSHRLPDLYQDVPYTIYGYTDSLSDFYIFLQGKYYHRWLDIKHLISFSSAQETSLSVLEEAWTIHRAYDYYDQFLNDGHASHLITVQQILSPLKIPVAFQQN